MYIYIHIYCEHECVHLVNAFSEHTNMYIHTTNIHQDLAPENMEWDTVLTHTCMHTYIHLFFSKTSRANRAPHYASYRHTHTYTHMHTYIQAYIHLIFSKPSHANKVPHYASYRHTHTYTHMHTYIHTCIHLFFSKISHANKLPHYASYRHMHSYTHMHTYIHTVNLQQDIAPKHCTVLWYGEGRKPAFNLL